MKSVAPITLIAVTLGANAQPGAPTLTVEVVNEESNAVPVMPVGRQPYQSTFDVTSLSSSEDCDLVPVPEGKTLIVTSVGVTATTDGTAVPVTRVSVVRQRENGFTSFHYLDDLQQIHPTTWSGTYHPDVFGGKVINSEFQEITYELAICVGPPDAPATINSARGVVSGYLMEGGIVDGPSLAP